jgi:hypothetical protein
LADCITIMSEFEFSVHTGAKDKEHAMSEKLNATIAVAGIDIGRREFIAALAVRRLRGRLRHRRSQGFLGADAA